MLSKGNSVGDWYLFRLLRQTWFHSRGCHIYCYFLHGRASRNRLMRSLKCANSNDQILQQVLLCVIEKDHCRPIRRPCEFLRESPQWPLSIHCLWIEHRDGATTTHSLWPITKYRWRTMRSSIRVDYHFAYAIETSLNLNASTKHPFEFPVLQLGSLNVHLNLFQRWDNVSLHTDEFRWGRTSSQRMKDLRSDRVFDEDTSSTKKRRMRGNYQFMQRFAIHWSFYSEYVSFKSTLWNLVI